MQPTKDNRKTIAELYREAYHKRARKSFYETYETGESDDDYNDDDAECTGLYD